ncbi:hypothetical protein B0H13DRAFT_1926186 [Mycena leptocephala]|nr:hypothetical protein B0H13DRAFT_1926186 [Mycena leptocephala]
MVDAQDTRRGSDTLPKPLSILAGGWPVVQHPPVAKRRRLLNTCRFLCILCPRHPSGGDVPYPLPTSILAVAPLARTQALRRRSTTGNTLPATRDSSFPPPSSLALATRLGSAEAEMHIPRSSWCDAAGALQLLYSLLALATREDGILDRSRPPSAFLLAPQARRQLTQTRVTEMPLPLLVLYIHRPPPPSPLTSTSSICRQQAEMSRPFSLLLHPPSSFLEQRQHELPRRDAAMRQRDDGMPMCQTSQEWAGLARASYQYSDRDVVRRPAYVPAQAESGRRGWMGGETGEEEGREGRCRCDVDTLNVQAETSRFLSPSSRARHSPLACERGSWDANPLAASVTYALDLLLANGDPSFPLLLPPSSRSLPSADAGCTSCSAPARRRSRSAVSKRDASPSSLLPHSSPTPLARKRRNWDSRSLAASSGRRKHHFARGRKDCDQLRSAVTSRAAGRGGDVHRTVLQPRRRCALACEPAAGVMQSQEQASCVPLGGCGESGGAHTSKRVAKGVTRERGRRRPGALDGDLLAGSDSGSAQRACVYTMATSGPSMVARQTFWTQALAEDESGCGRMRPKVMFWPRLARLSGTIFHRTFDEFSDEGTGFPSRIIRLASPTASFVVGPEQRLQ